MQVLKRHALPAWCGAAFWRWVPVGLLTGIWWVVAVLALHTCAPEPALKAAEPSKMEAMQKEADAESARPEGIYERMSDEERMRGVVYEP